MRCFAVYKSATGQIVRLGQLADSDMLHLQAGEGEGVIEADELTSFDHKVVNGTLVYAPQAAVPIPLDAARAEAIALIDKEAEEIRGLFITKGSGQAMAYQQKKVEAEMVSVDPSINPDLVPHIKHEAALGNISLLDQAAIILSMAHQWTQVSSLIEQKRLAAKTAVEIATDIEAIRVAANVDWSSIPGVS